MVSSRCLGKEYKKWGSCKNGPFLDSAISDLEPCCVGCITLYRNRCYCCPHSRVSVAKWSDFSLSLLEAIALCFFCHLIIFWCCWPVGRVGWEFSVLLLMQTASSMPLFNCVAVNLSARLLWQLRRGLRGSEWFGFLWHSVIKRQEWTSAGKVSQLWLKCRPWWQQAMCYLIGMGLSAAVLCVCSQRAQQRQQYFNNNASIWRSRKVFLGSLCLFIWSSPFYFRCSAAQVHFYDVLGTHVPHHSNICFSFHPPRCLWSGRCLHPQVVGKQRM